MAGSGDQNPILEINLSFLRGTLALGLAWGLRQITSPEIFLVGWVAIVSGATGVWKVLEGVWGLVKLIKGERKLKKFERKGTKPKADVMAQTNDLKKAGILK